MPNYPYTFQLPPLNLQDIPSNGAVGEFLGISAGGVLDWLPVATGGGDMLKSENLSGLANYTTARTNIGLGTASTPTFANLTLTSPSLSSSAPVTISQTWNGTGSTVFTALKVNATTPGTTSSSSSLLLDLQVGGVSKVSVDKTSVCKFSNNGIFFDAFGADTSGFQYIGQEQLVVSRGLNGSKRVLLNNLGVFVGNASAFGFASTGEANATPDTLLVRDGAANTLALRNGAAAQTFRVYNTFPGTGNNEFGTLNWVDQPNEFQIATGQAGSGTGRALCLRSGGGINIRIGGAPGTIVWQFGTSTGHFLAATDNSVDIGASGANRPRNVYVGTGIISGGSVTTSSSGYLSWTGTSAMASTSVGVITLLNNTGTDFNRLNFGAFTDAAPAIARDGAGIKFTGAAAGSTSWIKVPPVAVSALPLAATAGAGARAFVNNALAPTFGSAVTGGGAVLVPVYSDGSTWNVG